MIKLLLAGFKGVGKTTCGRLVAQKLAFPFFDTDEILSSRYKKSIRALYQELQEERFREEEAKVLQELKNLQEKVVIALGGGTLLHTKTQEIAPDMGSLVYLYASEDTLLERLDSASFLDHNDFEGSFKHVFQKRHPLFCKVCQYRVDVDMLTPDEVAKTILDFYG